jgi:hypothetical protein
MKSFFRRQPRGWAPVQLLLSVDQPSFLECLRCDIHKFACGTRSIKQLTVDLQRINHCSTFGTYIPLCQELSSERRQDVGEAQDQGESCSFSILDI